MAAQDVKTGAWYDAFLALIMKETERTDMAKWEEVDKNEGKSGNSMEKFHPDEAGYRLQPYHPFYDIFQRGAAVGSHEAGVTHHLRENDGKCGIFSGYL